MNKFERALEYIKENIDKDSQFYKKIFLVGGCVRDELLGQRFSDLDLLIDMPDGQKKFVEYMCATHPDVCRGPFYYKRYGTTAMDMIIDGTFTLVECVEPHIEQYNEEGTELLETQFCTLEEDAKRRDYTCNALYKNLHTGKTIDPSGMGIADLKAKYLRTPGNPDEIYLQDPVRMLRGIRFKHQKGFELDAEAWDAIVRHHDRIVYSAPTRMREEVHKMLKSSDMPGAFDDLEKSGLLPYLFPGLEKYINKDIKAEHLREDFTIWSHTRLALSIQLKEHPHTEIIYRLAVLFADIAILDGIETVQKILKESLGSSKEKVLSVVQILRNYLRFRTFFNSRKYIITKSSVWPKFLNALCSKKAEFRRMVRALNHGMQPDKTLPYELLFDNAEMPIPAARTNKNSPSPEERAAIRKARNKRKRERQKLRKIREIATSEQR